MGLMAISKGRVTSENPSVCLGKMQHKLRGTEAMHSKTFLQQNFILKLILTNHAAKTFTTLLSIVHYFNTRAILSLRRYL